MKKEKIIEEARGSHQRMPDALIKCCKIREGTVYKWTTDTLRTKVTLTLNFHIVGWIDEHPGWNILSTKVTGYIDMEMTEDRTNTEITRPPTNMTIIWITDIGEERGRITMKPGDTLDNQCKSDQVSHMTRHLQMRGGVPGNIRLSQA